MSVCHSGSNCSKEILNFNSPNKHIHIQSPLKDSTDFYTQRKNNNCPAKNPQEYTLSTPPKKGNYKLCLDKFTPIKLQRIIKSKRRNYSPISPIPLKISTEGEKIESIPFIGFDDVLNGDFNVKLEDWNRNNYCNQSSKTDCSSASKFVKDKDISALACNLFDNLCEMENPEKYDLFENNINNKIKQIVEDINLFKDYDKEGLQITLIGNDLSLFNIDNQFFFENLGNIRLNDETPSVKENKFFVTGIASIYANNMNEYVNYNCRLIFGFKEIKKLILEKLELHSF